MGSARSFSCGRRADLAVNNASMKNSNFWLQLVLASLLRKRSLTFATLSPATEMSSPSHGRWIPLRQPMSWSNPSRSRAHKIRVRRTGEENRSAIAQVDVSSVTSTFFATHMDFNRRGTHSMPSETAVDARPRFAATGWSCPSKIAAARKPWRT